MLVNLRMQRLQDDLQRTANELKLSAAGFPDTPGTFAIVCTDTMPRQWMAIPRA